MRKKILACFLGIMLLLAGVIPALAANPASAAAWLRARSSIDHWGLLALSAYGEDVSGYQLAKPTSATMTDWEAYVLGEVALGQDTAEATSLVKAAQLADGKFADSTTSGGEDLLNAHVWGVLSLHLAGVEDYDRAGALSWLKAQQNDDGSFAIFVGGAGDLDMTAMSVLALYALGVPAGDTSVAAAWAYLDANAEDLPSSEALAWNIMSRVQYGKTVPQTLTDALAKYQNTDGGYVHLLGLSRSDYMSTSHSLLAACAVRDGETFLSLFKSGGVESGEEGFSDLTADDYGYEALLYWADKGVIGGYPDGTVRPAAFVTRGEFAKMLSLALSLPAGTAVFDDMPSGHWAASYAASCEAAGLVRGVGNNCYNPSANISGAELAVIAVRAAGREDQVNKNSVPWYSGYVALAQNAGLLYEGFAATEAASRAECAVVLQKLAELGK